MKKHLFLLSLALGAVFGSLAAQEMPMISQLITVPVQLSDNNGALSVTWSKDQVNYSIQGFRALSITDISLVDASLRIAYVPTYPESDITYRISAALDAGDGALIYAGPKALNEGLRAEGGRLTGRYLLWKDLVEKQANLGTPYLLILRVDIMGRVCEEIPSLSLSKKLPYVGAAVVGAGLIGIGQIYRQQANTGNDDYRRAWAAGDDASLEQARKDFDTYKTLTYAGIGILALDGVLYLLRTNSVRKAKKRYQTFCVEKPQVAIHPTLNSSTDLGFQLRIKF